MSSGRADFFKFPPTPHLYWLGKAAPRADKVLGPEEASEFLRGEVIVEEKVDGANLGISVSVRGELVAQNRGTVLGAGAHPQFEPLRPWLGRHRAALVDALGRDLMLFGEWCFAVHSLRYTRLPDWFLGFDVYDRAAGRFWSTRRRDELLRSVGLAGVPELGRGRFDRGGIMGLMGASRLSEGLMEGVYIRREEGDWLLDRSKVVRAEFVQSIEEHWSSKRLEKNALVTARAS